MRATKERITIMSIDMVEKDEEEKDKDNGSQDRRLLLIDKAATSSGRRR